MTELNTIANIADINQLQSDHLQNTIRKFMQDSNNIANIAPIKQLEREVKEHQKSVYEGNKHPCSFQATQNRHLKTSHEGIMNMNKFKTG